jgi:hypothetical protein
VASSPLMANGLLGSRHQVKHVLLISVDGL